MNIPEYEALMDSGDAMKWAEGFCKTYREVTNQELPDEFIEPGWMVGWFANAMESGRRKRDNRA